MKKAIILLLFVFILSVGSAASFPNQSELEAAGAYDTLNNMQNLSNVSINLSDYEMIAVMTTWDENDTDYNNSVRIVGAPYNSFWASEHVLGYWFYVLVMFITIIMVYGKSKSLEVTSMITCLLSILIIMPSLASMIIVPTPVLVILYVFATLGFAGVLLSLFGGSD